MHVLITRPRSDAEALARQLEARGHEVLIEPLLTIRALEFKPIALDDAQALIVTSANAVRALRDAAILAARPVYAVGEASARAARAAGAREVHTGPGDGRALAEVIAAERDPGAGALVHLCGAEVRPGLAEALLARGFCYRAEVVYRAEPATTLSEGLERWLRRGLLEAALFFSPRSAKVFSDLVRVAGLGGGIAGAAALCLSAAVAANLRDLPWRTVRIAARPDQAALLGLLEGSGGR